MTRLLGCFLVVLLFAAAPLQAAETETDVLTAKAIERYRKALAVDPGNLPLRYYLGVSLLLSGHNREAIEQFRQAYPGFSDSVEANYNLALAYARLDDPDSALLYLERADDLGAGEQPELFPLTNFYFNLALSYMDSDQPQDAIRLLHRVVARSVDNSEARRLLGGLYLGRGEVKKAAEQWQLVLEDQPEDNIAREALYTIRFNRGLQDLEEGRNGAARDAFLAALELEQESALCHYYLGYLQYQDKNFQQAIELLLKAAPGVPEDMHGSLAAMVYNSAATLLEEGRPEEAKAAADFLAASRQTETQAHYLTGNIHLALKMYPQARDEYLKVLEADPTHVGANLNLQKADRGASEEYYAQGRALYRQGDLSAAIGKLETALKINPGHGMARAYLEQSRADIRKKATMLIAQGRSDLQSGHFRKALEAARQVLHLQPDNEAGRALEKKAMKALEDEIRLALAEADSLYRAGAAMEAEKTWRTVLRLAPGNQLAREGLDHIRKQREENIRNLVTEGQQALETGGLGEARKSFQAALALDPQDRAAREGLERTEALVSSLVTEEIHWARRSRQAGQVSEAREHYNKALRLRPDPRLQKEVAELNRAADRRVETLLAAASTAAEKGQMNKARSLLAKAAAVIPDNAAVLARQRDLEADIALRMRKWLAGAQAGFSSGDYQAALTRFRRILDLDPGNSQAVTGIRQTREALAARLQGRVVEATSAIDKGDYSTAEEALGRARDIDPYNRAAEEQQKRLKTIRRNGLAPEDAQQLYLQGIEFYTGGHYQDAIAAWQQVLTLQPQHEKARLNIEKARRKLAQLKAFGNG